MTLNRFTRTALAVLCVWCFGSSVPLRAKADAAWAALKSGGVALLLRHATTVPGTGDPPGFRLEDCSTQRNLSSAGKEEAVAIGEALRARALVFTSVRTSQWCRCRDTAQLLDLGPAEQWEPLNSIFDDQSSEETRRTQAVRAFIMTLVPGKSAVLVTHQVNITALTGISPAMGEGVVVRASSDPEGGLEVIGRLRPAVQSPLTRP